MRVEVRNNNVDKALKILKIRRELKNKQKQFEELGF